MSPRIGMLIVLATFVGWSGFCGWLGYSLRDGQADEAAAKVEVAAQATRANVVQEARATDHDNARHAAIVERQRIEADREIEITVRAIETKATDYAHANPVPLGCALTDDGLRAWAASNAGRFPTGAGPGDISRSAGALPGNDRAAEERKP